MIARISKADMEQAIESAGLETVLLRAVKPDPERPDQAWAGLQVRNPLWGGAVLAAMEWLTDGQRTQALDAAVFEEVPEWNSWLVWFPGLAYEEE